MRINNLICRLVLGTFAFLAVQLAARAAVTNIVLVSGPTVYNFAPTNITIATGDSIRWTNTGGQTHDVTPGVKVGNATNNPVPPVWAPASLALNGTFQAAFSNVGVYPYLCGRHVFLAVNGHPEQTGTVTVVQANLLPQVALLSPANLSSLAAPANINLSATASDADGSVSSVQFIDGTTLLGSVSAPPYDLSVTLAAGWHQIVARAIDTLGGSNTTDIVNVFVTTNRVINVSGLTFSPNNLTLTVGDTLTVNGLANFHTVTGSTNLEPFCGSVSPPSGFCQVTFNSVGSFPFHCIPHRSFGMTGLVTVLGPQLRPVVTLNSPVNGSVFAAPANIRFEAAASDPLGFVKFVRFVRSPSSSLGTVTNPPLTLTISNVAAGNYSYTALVTDNLNLLGTSAVVNITVVAPVDIQLLSPTATANGFQFEYTANPGLTYVIEASAADGAPVPFIPIATNPATATRMTFIDTTPGARADRVYRVSRRP